MDATRKAEINGHKVREYLWAPGRLKIFIDSYQFDGDWNAAIASCQSAVDHRWRFQSDDYLRSQAA